MTDEANFTLTLDADLRDRFIAEADATMRAPEEIVRELMRDFVAQRPKSRVEIDSEIAQAIREADVPAAEIISDDQVGDDWLRQRNEYTRRISSDAA